MKFKYRIMPLFRVIQITIEVFLAPILCLYALRCRFKKKSIDVGIGPMPIISHYYHKKALELFGYTAETFVATVWFVIEEFDIRADQLFVSNNPFLRKPLRYFAYLYLGFLALSRYRSVLIYFIGGPFAMGTPVLRRLEPILYKLANVKTIVTAYGADVQELTRTQNLLFKHAYASDYPEQSLRRASVAADIDRWTKYADHIIGGCEWVDYMYYWDTLMLVHFSIDVEQWKPAEPEDGMPLKSSRKVRILHAPNHRALKGSKYFIEACKELAEEGVDVELVILEGVPNDQVHTVMATVDVVADQLVVGWYAMFAMEAMALGKPVLCYLREDLEDLYVAAGLVAPGEIPIINCSPLTVKETIRTLVANRDQLPELGRRSREFVVKHHSLETVGGVFDRINRSLGVKPSKIAQEAR